VTLAPLLAAPAVIQIHVAAALLALLCGLLVMALRKGTVRHRRMGWGFAAAMATTALSSLLIARSGHFSAIHLLTLATLITLPYGLIMRRRGRIGAHRSAMVSLVFGLAIAGAFTLMPGRLMHQVTFGQALAGR
jgi:uncharacterized membrane protein